MSETGSDAVDMTRTRPFYTRALEALEAAHKACFKHPDRDILGMSHGPFAGVNVALGIVVRLESERTSLLAENERLRAALQEYGDHTYECEMKERAGSCTCGYEAAIAGEQTATLKNLL